MEDAGVYDLDGDTVLVQTVDFITPILDDPYSFGQAAAANSLSDIYAMGARPITALNLLAFPAKLKPPDSSVAAGGTPGQARVRGATDSEDVIAAILRGGRDKAAEAGAAIIGGHSVDDPEPKYGLAVTGIARRSELLLQSAGKPGDVLFLTKPIGGGVLSTALKRGGVGPGGLAPEALAELTAVLAALNGPGCDAAQAVGARCATDVTGFGLLGHLSNIVLASGVGAEIQASEVPAMAAALELASSQGEQAFPGGAARNLDFAASRLDLAFAGEVELWRRLLLADPMTSGGLLVAVAETQAEAFARLMIAALSPRDNKMNLPARKGWCSRIGRLTGQAGRIAVSV